LFLQQGSVGTAPPNLDLLGQLFCQPYQCYCQPYQCYCACHACLNGNYGVEQLVSIVQENRVMKKLDETSFSYRKCVANAVDLGLPDDVLLDTLDMLKNDF
jgi:hypothetical protein